MERIVTNFADVKGDMQRGHGHVLPESISTDMGQGGGERDILQRTTARESRRSDVLQLRAFLKVQGLQLGATVKGVISNGRNLGRDLHLL